MTGPGPRRVYADHAATSPLRPAAAEAQRRTENLLNPAGQYASGREARRVLEESREEIAALLGADPVEVVFTASGTEADGIALQGLAFASRRRRGARTVVASETEHPAVGETVAWLTGDVLGFDHAVLPVDADGRPAVPDAADLDPARDAVVTAMWANNETGAVTDVAGITAACARADVPVHVDAVQAVGHLPVDFHRLGATTLAASAHKFGGPRSAGILLVRRDAVLDSPLRGGGQERGLRPGTVDVRAAAGTAAALAAACRDMEAEAARVGALRDRVLACVRAIDGARVWTTEPALPGHAHMSFPGAEGDSLIMLLDAAGIDAATGSACSAGVNRASHVLTAMGVPVEVARGALRLTLGHTTTEEDVARIVEVLPGVVERARAAGMAY
ncbi:cysteine desulfurase family protein [Corynebacterium bovis]|uniref:Cysteine desulfurase n=1 Tax=Corynebacterium bovis TaxID=36808 RepID=A0A426Q220_9CORY|nr:cysteine desulfurase family protein [Corynebacterium bovis]MDN8579176.1 cysteine desulfurase family protein [Corynebacterium bovis]RRO88003.1 cysteine desulfurase [Corynebacterium bovis]RRO90166.1 cysteine desulfurase [Corynebacterium bovis]